jgi:F420-0:gamma-glutamyl ligase-like protein
MATAGLSEPGLWGYLARILGYIGRIWGYILQSALGVQMKCAPNFESIPPKYPHICVDAIGL